MKDTGVFVNSTPPPLMARGYSWNAGKFEPALDWDMSWAGGAGALYSTVGDLFRWNEALFEGHVMSEASFRAAITPVVLPPNVDGMKYGYGLTMYELKGLSVIGHGGGLNGWSSQLLRLPDQRCTVVALGNSLPPHPGQAPTEICQFLAEKLLAADIAKVPPPIEDKSIDPKFPAFASVLRLSPGVMTVTVEATRFRATHRTAEVQDLSQVTG
jgi:CubicO group peptidase (beta-lactamase class C family)